MIFLDLMLLSQNLDLVSDLVLGSTLDCLITEIPLIPLVERSVKRFLLVRGLIKASEGIYT